MISARRNSSGWFLSFYCHFFTSFFLLPFFTLVFLLSFFVFLSILFICTVALHPQSVHAASSVTTSTSVTVLPSCNLKTSTQTHTATINPGTHNQIGSSSTLIIACNNPSGYSLYAVGLNNANEEGQTDLIGTTPTNKIPTGTATSGASSSWHMKLSNPSAGLAISSSFDENHAIPSSRTAIASRSTGASNPSGDTVNISYSAYIPSSQPPDTYTGKVKYVLFQPAASTAKTMQTFSCSSLQENQMITLIDTRDNNPYTVAKLKDGKCWMTQNLRLGDSGLKNRTLTSADSDVTANYTLPASAPTGFNDNTASKLYVDGINGGNYTFAAATAGTGNSATIDGAEATNSICPKGWHLPTKAEALALIDAYSGNNATGSVNLQAKPIPGFLLSGNYIGDAPDAVDRLGIYWTSTSQNSSNAGYLRIDGTSAFVAFNVRSTGRPVRCLAKQ